MKRIQHSVSVLSVVCLMLCIPTAHARPKKKIKKNPPTANIAKLFPYKGKWTGGWHLVLNVDSKGKCDWNNNNKDNVKGSWSVQDGSLILNSYNFLPGVYKRRPREIFKFTPHANGQKMEVFQEISYEPYPSKKIDPKDTGNYGILDRQWAN